MPISPRILRLGAWLPLYLALWTAAGFLFSTPVITLNHTIPGAPPLGDVLAVIMTGWYMRALFALVVVVLAVRLPIRRAAAGRTTGFHLLASIAFALTKIGVCAWLTRQLEYLPDAEFHRLFVAEFPLDVATYWVVLGLAHGMEAYRRLRAREVEAARLSARAAQLQEQLSRAQLDALKAQLQPHFLFNTLHSISALIHESPEAADQMVEQLSDLLRRVIENSGAQEVSLREELDLLDRYLSIQRTRYRDRLSTRVEVEPEALDARVPNLILQPLVENAIRHGIEQRTEGGRVEVRAAREGGALLLRVRNDGPGPLARRGSSGTGVGLANTRARLRQLYGAEHTLSLTSGPGGGSEVTLRLPYRAAEAELAAETWA